MTDKISSGAPAPRSPDAGDSKETQEQRALREAREAMAKSLSPTEEQPKVRKLAALAAMGRVAVPTDLNVLKERLSRSTFGQVVRDLQQVKAEEDNFVALARSHPHLAKARPNYPAMYKIYQERLNQLYSPAALAMGQPANPTPTIAEAIALLDLIESRDANGNTEVGRMAAKGDLQRVRTLIQLGADVNAISIGNWTPLMLAAAGGHIAVVEELLSRGANIHAKSTSGNTALHQAATYGSGENHLEVMKRLLAAGVDANVADQTGETALSTHLRGFGMNPLIVRTLLVNATQASKDRALINAARMGHNAAIEELLEQGANIDARGADGCTALMSAAAYGGSTTVQLLIDKHASLDLKDEDGDTALTLAAACSMEENVQRLLNAGADVTIKNRMGLNALDRLPPGNHNEGIRQMLQQAMLDSGT
jgi:ankyrin repeat protein